MCSRLVPVVGLALSGCGLFDFGPDPQPIPFSSVAIVADGTLAGSVDGHIYTSRDGSYWAEVIYLAPRSIDAVYSDADVMLGVGGPYWATNWPGSGWLGWDSQAQTELAGLGGCFDAWWVAGAGGYAARSVDGNNWFPIGGISASADIIDLSCGPSFVLLASYAQQSGYWTTVDGSSISNVSSPADTCSVTHANGSFYALATDGRVFQSPDDDANTWTQVNQIAWPELVPWCTVRYGAQTFCVLGDDVITCCDADWMSCVELELPSDAVIKDLDLSDDGRLQAVGPEGWFMQTTCADGVCEPPEIITGTFDPDFAHTVPVWDAGGEGGNEGGSCDPCTADVDCTGVAERNGVAGAACGDDGLCYACFQVCDGMGANCHCITCAEGCGTGAVCTGGNLCTFEIDGKLPCE